MFSRPYRYLIFVARYDTIDYTNFKSVNRYDISERPSMLIGRIDNHSFIRRKLNSGGLRRL